MIISIISQGLFWSILGLGIFMTFRILNFPDMTTEGSFPLGGAVAVTLITKGVNPLFGWFCNGFALYQRKNSDSVVWDFGYDLMPFLNPYDYGKS